MLTSARQEMKEVILLQKLSAMRYIRNNKRRVSVLVTAMAMSFFISYFTSFILSATERTLMKSGFDVVDKVQFAVLSTDALGIDANDTYENRKREYDIRNAELSEKIKADPETDDAFFGEMIYSRIVSTVGETTNEVPLVEKEELYKFTKRFDTKIKEGRMPENPGEIVVSSLCLRNQKAKQGGYFMENFYGKQYQIVGILDFDGYLAFGTKLNKPVVNETLIIFSGLKDIKPLFERIGIADEKSFTFLADHNSDQNIIKKEVSQAISLSFGIINISVFIIMGIILTIIYVIYLRDRHNEWCLYSSIGFSSREICMAANRELLFTFLAGITGGALLTSAAVMLTDLFLFKRKGLIAYKFQPDTALKILSAFVLFFGILQIPVRYALYRIRTVDAVDDDLR